MESLNTRKECTEALPFVSHYNGLIALTNVFPSSHIKTEIDLHQHATVDL